MGAHELVIKTSVESLEPEKELSQYVREDEIVSGFVFMLYLDIENIGRNKFPGGKIAKISFVSSVTTFYWPIDVSIPEIAPNKSKRVSKPLGIFANPDVYSFQFQIQPNDSGEMLYRRRRKLEAMKGSYISKFYAVVDGRQLEIISLLHKIVDRLPPKE